jgi:hypothetical protein
MKTFLLGAMLLFGCHHTKPATAVSNAKESQAQACTQEVARVCPAGTVDGCLGAAPTNVHVCALEDATPALPCANEVARVCPDGFVDACGLTPPAAASHVCVTAN